MVLQKAEEYIKQYFVHYQVLQRFAEALMNSNTIDEEAKKAARFYITGESNKGEMKAFQNILDTIEEKENA